jgi:hypothetical protein
MMMFLILLVAAVVFAMMSPPSSSFDATDSAGSPIGVSGLPALEAPTCSADP